MPSNSPTATSPNRAEKSRISINTRETGRSSDYTPTGSEHSTTGRPKGAVRNLFTGNHLLFRYNAAKMSQRLSSLGELHRNEINEQLEAGRAEVSLLQEAIESLLPQQNQLVSNIHALKLEEAKLVARKQSLQQNIVVTAYVEIITSGIESRRGK